MELHHVVPLTFYALLNLISTPNSMWKLWASFWLLPSRKPRHKEFKSFAQGPELADTGSHLKASTMLRKKDAKGNRDRDSQGKRSWAQNRASHSEKGRQEKNIWIQEQVASLWMGWTGFTEEKICEPQWKNCIKFAQGWPGDTPTFPSFEWFQPSIWNPFRGNIR